MGLLSDPEYGSVKWVRILKKVHVPLCFLCYVGAIVWFFMLGNRDFNNEAYFSENALLPGLVTNEFNAEASSKQFYNEFMQELEDKYSNSDAMPVPWLVAKMNQLHLDVYTHNFSLNYPFGEKRQFTGTNVYGILRAARTSSLEAVVISAPYRALSSHEKGTAAGIALMLAFAEFARPQKYWAKDLIFLITDHEQLGMQAWLEAYHGIKASSEPFHHSLGSFWKPDKLHLNQFVNQLKWGSKETKCLDPGVLKGRSGSIQAAINLEFHTPKIKYVEVKVEGLNGQLPNLDLVNLVHKLCVKSGIHHSYKSSYSWIRNRNKMDEWAAGVWTMLGMVNSQLAGVPNGNHGLFHRFGIEAVTLEGRDSSSAPRTNSLTAANFYRLGILLESVLRSLNNLLERFHQSYFFYLLANTNRFVSIGQYMPCLCLLCVALLVRALSLWVSLQDDDNDKDSNKKKKRNKKSEHKLEDNTRDNIKDDKEIAKYESENKLEDIKKTTEDAKEDSKKELRDVKKAKDAKVASEIEKLREEVVKKIEKEKKVGEEELLDRIEKKGKTQDKERDASKYFSIGSNYVLMHVIGYATFNSPVYLADVGALYGISPEASIYYGLCIISIIVMLLSPFWPRLILGRSFSIEELEMMTILVLVELATLCLCVAMQNFPFGFLLGLVYTPVVFLVKTGDMRSSRWHIIRLLVCMSAQPLILLPLSLSGAAMYSEYRGEGMRVVGEQSALHRGWYAALHANMYAVVDSMIYGNWLFPVATCVLLPIYNLFHQLLSNKVLFT